MNIKVYEAPKIGKKIRAARKDKKIGQTECARLCQLSRSQYCNIEADHYATTSLESIYRIARVLEISIDELLGLG
ncbi:helix-turn-helix domain-containing protein [Eubacterium sp.]|uniref:helix-turn-helix domain-containing protein n=1 Tax=Eubacterium sp. TaxID=142586 RepID=UPI002FCB9270